LDHMTWKEFYLLLSSSSSSSSFFHSTLYRAQVFSEYFGFPCQAFHRLLHTRHHPSSRAGTIGQIVADIPNGLSHSSRNEKKLELLRTYKIVK
jgi:hypothetical protein